MKHIDEDDLEALKLRYERQIRDLMVTELRAARADLELLEEGPAGDVAACARFTAAIEAIIQGIERLDAQTAQDFEALSIEV